MSILPPEVRAGYVYDRVLRAIGDRPYDEDRLPDGIPAQGRVIFRPKTAVKQLVSNGRGVTVTREPVICTIHQGANQPDDSDPEKGGLLIDEAGAVGGVWLVVGEWTVEYHMEDRYSNIPNEEIIVTEEHTKDNPLDIALASEITPTPTQKFVVNEQIYVDSKNYRNEALEFRNDAQEAFEKFTWPVHVQDTPPEDTRVIWVNPDEPAGTASDWALRAESAADRAENSLRIDTSVGIRVFFGDVMIFGDTGWRDISAEVEGLVEGEVKIKRGSTSVWLHFESAGFEDQGTSYTYISRMIPQGFRYGGEGFIRLAVSPPTARYSTGPIRADQYGHIQISDSQGKLVSALVQWETGALDSWPTNLPGISF